MVHFYRAAPQPKSETETYIMYGLVAVAIILGLFYLYRRNQKKSKLAGTSWKRYVSPDYSYSDPNSKGQQITESRFDFLVFDAQKGVTVKTGAFAKRDLVPELAVTYSDDGKMRGRLDENEKPNTDMTYSFEVDKHYGNLLVITTIPDNKVYKLIKTSEPTAPDTA